MTQQDVAEALEWSTSKLVRIENGAVGISITDLKALLLHYGITDEGEIGQLVDMARAGRKSTWWHEYKSRVSSPFYTFLGLEASAIRIRQYQNLVVPGLLQAPAYIEQLAPVAALNEDNARANVEIRVRRQGLITADHGAEAFFILDESVLYRQVGDVEVMREQLLRLKELLDYPNISIRILPFSAGVHRAMKSSFEVLDLSEEKGDYALLIEQPYKDQLIPDPNDESREFVQYFDELQEVALPTVETPKIIDERLAELKRKG